MPKKNWSELTRPQKAGIIALSLVQLGLLIAALRDIRQRSDSEIKGNRKMWMALSFIDFIGPLAYFRFGRK
jgi:hypothetical protein